MTIRYSFPGPSGLAQSADLRRDLAGTVVRNATGVVRAGLLPRLAQSSVVLTKNTMSVDVYPFEAVLNRSGALFIANDATFNVTLDAAPASNSRYDVVYVKQNEQSAPYGDASDAPVLAVQKGAASAAPDKAAVLAALPEGALPLASVLIPSTALSTQSAGVVLAQEFPMTAMSGGTIIFRTIAERNAFTGTRGQDAFVIANNTKYVWTVSSGWLIVGGQLPHVEFGCTLTALDDALTFPIFGVDAANSTDTSIASWQRYSGSTNGDPGGFRIAEPGIYSMTFTLSLAGGATDGTRSIMGIEDVDTNPLARFDFVVGEARGACTIPNLRTTTNNYDTRWLFRKTNGNLGSNVGRARITRIA